MQEFLNKDSSATGKKISKKVNKGSSY